MQARRKWRVEGELARAIPRGAPIAGRERLDYTEMMARTLRRQVRALVISAAAALTACLDENPRFMDPQATTSTGSASQTSTGGTAGPGTSEPGTTETPTTGPANSSSDTDLATSATSSDTIAETTDTTTGTSTSSTATGPMGECGNNVVEIGEECDNGPGNGVDADCTPVCTVNVCGDGYPHLSNEDCDDGNGAIDDGCIACIKPRTCAEILSLAPGAPTGPYKIDLDGMGPEPTIPVFCDMMLNGGGWTLLERSPFGDQAIGYALYKEVPVNMNDPMLLRHRLPRGVMDLLINLSTEAYIGCEGADRLITDPLELLKGEFGPQNCSGAGPVHYFEAQLKGHLLQNVDLCTGFLGTMDGECQGAWRVNEYEQDQPCQLPPYPWQFMVPITSDGADAFAVDPAVPDGMPPVHDCHKPGARRMIMVR